MSLFFLSGFWKESQENGVCSAYLFIKNMWFGDIGLKDDLPTFNLPFSPREYIKSFQKREWEIHVYLDVFFLLPLFSFVRF